MISRRTALAAAATFLSAAALRAEPTVGLAERRAIAAYRESRYPAQEKAIQEAAGRYGFVSGKSTHADRIATIRDTFQRFGVTIDTHTADGVKVAREHTRPGVPMLVLETALPIKFAETIVEALGRPPERPAKFEGIEALPKRVQVMPADVVLVKAYISRHCA